MGRVSRWRWQPRYAYRVVLPDAENQLFLKYRGNSWKTTANGYDLEQWFKDHGKGLMKFTIYPTRDHYFGAKTKVEIGFTNRDTAVLCKLVMGGR